ncbi:hypothetical protein Oscil6304_4476 [Oscillatoria acuminata PCC 6304]|uniref:Uncharacterized protein n=1 Tax=Oscillatoria acuminata PCC 6304 TaxID=56110 RepID=K9TNL7_9CYAN|nr:hypothetical protein Oscil6304_4476 [Oscillatoria acuminata PCC 6304]
MNTAVERYPTPKITSQGIFLVTIQGDGDMV